MSIGIHTVKGKNAGLKRNTPVPLSVSIHAPCKINIGVEDVSQKPDLHMWTWGKPLIPACSTHQLITEDSEFYYQLLRGSIQSSVLTTTTTLSTGESHSSKTMCWECTSCIQTHFLKSLPCYPLGQGRSSFVCLCFWKLLYVWVSIASSNRIGSERVSLPGFRVKDLGPASSSAIFVPIKKNSPLRLELSGCLSCSQIYLGPSTNEIKLPLYQGLVCEEQSIIPFIASHALSLI